MEEQEKELHIGRLRETLKAYYKLRRHNSKELQLNGTKKFPELEEAQKSSIKNVQNMLAMIVIGKIQKFLLRRKSLPVGLVKGIKQSDLLLKDKVNGEKRFEKLKIVLRRFMKTFIGCYLEKKKHKKKSKIS